MALYRLVGSTLATKLIAALDVEASFSGGGTVSVIDADGSDKITLVSGDNVVEPDCVEADLSGGKIYWGNMGPGGSADKSVAVDDGSIMRADLDGSSVETLVSTDLKSPVGIALDTAKGKMYFTDQYNNNIKRANLDGTDVEVVVNNTEYPVDLALNFDSRYIYWTARKEGAVYRTNMDENGTDGAGLKPLVTGLETPIGMALDRETGKIYYTEVLISTKSGAIWEADSDGSNTRKLASLTMPLGISLSEK